MPSVGADFDSACISPGLGVYEVVVTESKEFEAGTSWAVAADGAVQSVLVSLKRWAAAGDGRSKLCPPSSLVPTSDPLPSVPTCSPRTHACPHKPVPVEIGNPLTIRALSLPLPWLWCGLH